MTGTGFDAIVLAGGRASRLGGAQKPLLEVGGTALLTRTVAAARSAGAKRIIVVAERMLDDPLLESSPPLPCSRSTHRVRTERI